MNYRTYQDLSITIKNHIYKIPKDIDLVVGVPRSGLIPATMIAQILNKPIVAVDSYIEGTIYEMGLYRRPEKEVTNGANLKKVLVVDDSINSGGTLLKLKEKLKKSKFPDVQVIFLAVYYVPGSLDQVDIGLEECSWPRIFQWNILNSWVLENACLDIDGVICLDPTDEENDDGSSYLKFISEASSIMFSNFTISCLVTSRLEKYRNQTELWLEKNGIKYGELIMLNLPSKKERQRLNAHASFKASVYKNRKEILFVESEYSQAQQIACLTGKQVFCTENMQMVEYITNNLESPLIPNQKKNDEDFFLRNVIIANLKNANVFYDIKLTTESFDNLSFEHKSRFEICFKNTKEFNSQVKLLKDSLSIYDNSCRKFSRIKLTSKEIDLIVEILNFPQLLINGTFVLECFTNTIWGHESLEHLVSTLKSYNLKLSIICPEGSFIHVDDSLMLLSILNSRNLKRIDLLCSKISEAISLVFFSHSSKLSGAERSLIDLVADFAENKTICTVVLPEDGPLKTKILSRGGAVIVVPDSISKKLNWWWANKSEFNFDYGKTLGSINLLFDFLLPEIRKCSPDIVFTQTNVIPWGAIAAHFLNIPHVTSVREYGSLDHCLKYYYGLRESMDALYNDSDLVCSISSDVCRELFPHDPESKSLVIFSDIKLEDINNEIDNSNNAGFKSSKNIGIFGNISEGKGQKQLVEAFLLVVEKCNNLQCYIVGEIVDKSYLEQINLIIQSSNYSSHFHFVDFVENPYNLMSRMDVIVSCSKREALGRTLIEGALLEKAIIFSDGGGPKEIFSNEKHGLMYKYGNVEDLALKLLLTLDDEVKTFERIVAAKEHLKEFFKVSYYNKLIEKLTNVRSNFTTRNKSFVFELLTSQNFLSNSDLAWQVISTKASDINDANNEIVRKISIGYVNQSFSFKPTKEITINLLGEKLVEFQLLSLEAFTLKGRVVKNCEVIGLNSLSYGDTKKFIPFSSFTIYFTDEVSRLVVLGELKIASEETYLKALRMAQEEVEVVRRERVALFGSRSWKVVLVLRNIFSFIRVLK